MGAQYVLTQCEHSVTHWPLPHRQISDFGAAAAGACCWGLGLEASSRCLLWPMIIVDDVVGCVSGNCLTVCC